MSEHPTPEHIVRIGLGFWASKALLSAIEMEVFTELAKRPEDLETLRGRLGLHPRSARDFLDTLVALGFLQRVYGKYGNAPATDLFLDKHKTSYMGGMLEMANHRLYRFWGNLTEALRTGQLQNEAKEGGFVLLKRLKDPVQQRTLIGAAILCMMVGLPFLVPMINAAIIGLFWFMFKVAVIVYIMIWFRGAFPRFRYDQLMNIEWKYMIPIGIGALIVNAILGMT